MAGKFVMQIGQRGQSKGNTDTANVHQPADVFVDTTANELYVADGYGNQRVIVFDAETGKFKRMWGAFGNAPPADARAEPAGAATADDAGRPAGSSGWCTPSRCRSDGVVYVADRTNNRIQVFTTAGKFLRQVRIDERRQHRGPVPAGFAFSPDEKQQFLYVVDSGPMRVVIFDRATMTQIGASAARAEAPASSTSCITWPPTRRAISTPPRSSPTGARSGSCCRSEIVRRSTRAAMRGRPDRQRPIKLRFEHA